jgi:hypothetical protein
VLRIIIFCTFCEKIIKFSLIFAGLYLIVYGRTEVLWKTGGRKTGSSRFEGKDIYILTKIYLFGGEDAPAIEMASGTYRYDFMQLLPNDIPASFDLKYKNNIRYRLEACLDIPWAFDKRFKLEFIVHCNYDLNMFPELKKPVQVEEVKDFCCFCCSQHLVMTLSVPQTGYTPGENIPFIINFNNKSRYKIKRTKIYLTRVIRLKR